MSSCVCKILFKSEQICGCCCKMLRGSLFWDTRYVLITDLCLQFLQLQVIQPLWMGTVCGQLYFALLSSSFHSQFLLSQQLTDLTFTVFFLYPQFLAHCNSAVLTASTDCSARHSDRGCHPCPFCQILFLLFNPYIHLPNPHHSAPLIPPCLFPIPSRHLARLFTLSFFSAVFTFIP